VRSCVSYGPRCRHRFSTLIKIDSQRLGSRHTGMKVCSLEAPFITVLEMTWSAITSTAHHRIQCDNPHTCDSAVSVEFGDFDLDG
jgi:hypothetical protein